MPDDDVKAEPKEEPKPEVKPAAKPGLKDGRQTPVYNTLQPVILSTTRQEYPAGTLLDLSHLPQKSIRVMIEMGLFETASGTPVNEPAQTAAPCKNC